MPTINSQTNAAHSWGVVAICHALWPDCSRLLLLAAIYHDVPEYVTGDIPADAKWKDPFIRKGVEAHEKWTMEELGLETIFEDLTEQEKKMLKIADMMELCWFCRDEITMGNVNMEPVLGRGHKYIWDLITGEGEWTLSTSAMLGEVIKARYIE